MDSYLIVTSQTLNELRASLPTTPFHKVLRERGGLENWTSVVIELTSIAEAKKLKAQLKAKGRTVRVVPYSADVAKDYESLNEEPKDVSVHPKSHLLVVVMQVSMGVTADIMHEALCLAFNEGDFSEIKKLNPDAVADLTVHESTVGEHEF